MMSLPFNISLTKRLRRRKLKSAESIEQLRYVLNWRDPKTGAREQRFFDRQKDAQDARNELIAAYERGNFSPSRKSITVADAVAAWLEMKRGSVRAITYQTYVFQARYVTGPLLGAEGRKAIVKSGIGVKPKNAHMVECLGRLKVSELTTSRIRAWHKVISDEVSAYSAGKAKMILNAALALAAEGHEFRPPAMPMGLPRQSKPKKLVLNPEQVAKAIDAARSDGERGVYVAFPFLAGTRPSEQLGLMWDSVDFDANVIHITRVQNRDGSVSEVTKTEAGLRSVPMAAVLRELLLAWRVRCPRRDGKLERVFAAPGNVRAWPLPRENGGGPLQYGNFRSRFWAPAMRALGLPAVTPHSARDSFISTLQAEGVEVGLVAKLAGHKNAAVTLSHYTHAMRGGEAAVGALDRAFGGAR